MKAYTVKPLIVAMLMISSATSFLTTKQTFHDSTHPACPTLGILCVQKKQKPCFYNSCSLKYHDKSNGRRHLQPLVSARTPDKDLYSESWSDAAKLGFPKFVKEGSQVKVEKSEEYIKLGSGTMYRDIKVGVGEGIKEKQKVSVRYNYYNQSGLLIESKKFEGSLAQLTDKFCTGLKEGIQGMKPGGKRRIIILLSSSAEYHVFDLELLSIKNCNIWNGWCRI